MAKKFTKEQKSAIEARGSDVLVAAAAGSGKTSVLTERIARLVSKENVDLDKLLVVTFTEAAAAEMRDRISRVLGDMLDANPGDSNLARQWTLVNKAQISTIHSFCLFVIRRYFYMTDLDPGFKIADETEASLLRAETMDELFESEYENGDVFFELLDCYDGGKTDDDALKEIVTRFHDFLFSLPFPRKWAREKLDILERSPDNGFEPWASVILEEVEQTLKGAAESAEKAMAIALGPDGPTHYVSALEKDMDIIAVLLSACERSYAEAYEEFSGVVFSVAPRKAKKAALDEEKSERVKKIRNEEIKKTVIGLKESYFFKPPDAVQVDLRATLRFVEKLTAMAFDFSERYSAAKRERGIADFGDLERFCLRILMDPSEDESADLSAGAPSQAARELQELFEHILIDEYQDSNAAQEMILSLVARENNRFMVGDVKQSVYKFRRASPEIFIKKYKSFSSDDDAPKRKIDLTRNFRSRKEVIDAVNFIFGRVMSQRLGDVVYDETAALKEGASFDETNLNVASLAEIHIISPETEQTDEDTEEYDKIALEANFIARRTEELVGRLNVFDGDAGYRPAKYSDIAIIMRSVKKYSSELEKSFKERNIPSISTAGEGYFDSLEIATALSFLRIIDNPRQDVPLLTVLASPVYRFSADELLRMRMAQPDGVFYEALARFDADKTPLFEKTLAFKEDLKKWREASLYMPVSDLIDLIYKDTDYLNMASADIAGETRRANLEALTERAFEYEKTSYKGLFNFNRFIEKAERSGVDYGAATLFSQDENAVRIMTIHKSKGLEFPIVFVIGLGRKFSGADERESFILHDELGFGPVYVDAKKRVRSKTLASAAVALKTRAESASEESRMLYVALTRAKEQLILTGVVNDIEKAKEKISAWNERKPPVYALKAGSCFFDWIFAALNDSAPFKIFIHSGVQSYLDVVQNRVSSAPSRETPAAAGSLDSADIRVLDEKFSWRYPFERESSLPAKLSISEIKRMRRLENLDDISSAVFDEPPFISRPGLTDHLPDAARMGTIIHTIIERLDIRLDDSERRIRAIVEELERMTLITPEEASLVPADKILAFTRSNLADRMRASKTLRKEEPFVIALPPYDIYRDETLKSSDALILVHGIIDCYFIERDENDEDGIILVDYKSDKNASPDALARKYSTQLDIYARALESAVETRVRERAIYLIDAERCVWL
ncbi:MAG: helicase-exonuclease AddAB subunit AddA [Clostridiales bacterium]|nr:helicase-exonuclease AddAB subunit AddA [Clostridiales bacterium]